MCGLVLLSYYLELLGKLQKQICRTVDPSLVTSFEPMAHHRNVASLSLFCRYFFGRCSSELAQLVLLPYSRGRSTRFSDGLSDFSVTISSVKKMFMSTISYPTSWIVKFFA